MKLLTLIVHADVQGPLADTLRSIPDVNGFVFTAAEGHGELGHADERLSARDRVVGYVPHVRATLILEDAAVDRVLAALKASDCGVRNSGAWWVSAVERQGSL